MGEILRVSAASIKIFVGVNDLDWFKFLSRRSNIEEANFWQPGGRSEFRALQPGELFLFKLHSPNNFIVGGGLFGHASIVPISLAWEAFGEMNGATSLEEMRRRVARYRRELPDDRTDYPIGCRILEQPFFWPLFWPRDLWLPIVDRWFLNIVVGKTFDAERADGSVSLGRRARAARCAPRFAAWSARRGGALCQPTPSNPTPWPMHVPGGRDRQLWPALRDQR